MSIELTPKMQCFINYIQDKADGKDVYIEEYENMSKQYLNAYREVCDKLLDTYLRKHKKAKLINVKLLIDIPQFNYYKGEIIQIYNKPVYDKLLPLILNRISFKYLKYWIPIEYGQYNGLSLYKWEFEIVR